MPADDSRAAHRMHLTWIRSRTVRTVCRTPRCRVRPAGDPERPSPMAILYRDPAAPEPDPVYVVNPTDAPLAALLAPEAPPWAAAASIKWGPARYCTRFRALWTTSGLALRFDCTDDGPWHTMSRRDDHLWEEEVVEIFIDPTGQGRDYAEVEISPANVVCDLIVRTPWPSLASDAAWTWPGLDSRVVATPSGPSGSGMTWTALARLPWEGVGALGPAAGLRVPPRVGDAWRANLFRIKRPHGPAEPERDAVYAAWSVPEGPSFHVPASFRPLVFAGPLAGVG